MAFVDQFSVAKENFTKEQLKIKFMNFVNEDFAKTNKIVEEDFNSLGLSNKAHIVFAIDSGYKTAQRRNKTMPQRESKDVISIFEELATKLTDYFSNSSPSNWIDFKDNLNIWRSLLVKEFKAIRYDMTVGEAQKIINMAFKFMYCFSDASRFENWFKYCHMPLDGYILDWCKQAQVKGRNGKKIVVPDSWSTMNDDDRYNDIQLSIRIHLSERNNRTFETIYLNENCFQSEFVIWQYMKEKESLNTIMKSLGNFNIKHLSCIDKKYISAASKNVDNIKAMICKLNDWIK